MSSNKTPATSAPPAREAPFLTFPPFPEVPADSGLVPFKDFRPSGIQISVSGDEEIEVDGLGIPTVELRVKHDTDEPKTGKKRKKKSKSAKNAGFDGEPVKRLTWWEDWEEGEDLRVSSTGYSSAFSRVDRLFKASRDFTEGRKWPGVPTGVRVFWDQYRIYVGLLVTPTVYRKPLPNAITNKRSHDEAGDDVSDDNENPKVTVGTDELDQKAASKKHRRFRPDYNDADAAIVDDDDDDDDDEEEDDEAAIAKKRADAEEFREEKLIAFLNDPEKSTMIFLSSYMREQGMIWADRNLVTGPRLTAFFINFLLRNRALPESNHERGLRRAVEVTTVALKELPLTAEIGKAMPDTISMALKECFGRMTGGSFQMDGAAILEGWAKCADKGSGEREKKRLKVDEETSAATAAAENNQDGKRVADKTVDEFEAELKAANIEVIHTDSLSADDDIMKQIVDDNVGMDVDVDPGNSAEWGSSDNAWGADNGGWDQSDGGNVLDIPATTGSADVFGWGSNSTQDPWADMWSAPKVSLLMQLLGPTVLPLTHTTGIVEQSTRRIKSVIHPPANPAKSVAGEGDGEDPESVEEELEKQFAKVVLEPWVGDDDSDIRTPIIRSTSKGRVYPGSKMEDGTVVEGDIPPPEAKVHNPLESDITLLIEPSSVNLMSAGMGILATWIQIVRQEKKQSGSGGSSGGKSKKKKKGKSKVPKGYWYMEELLVTFPSFYTEEKPVQTA